MTGNEQSVGKTPHFKDQNANDGHQNPTETSRFSLDANLLPRNALIMSEENLD